MNNQGMNPVHFQQPDPVFISKWGEQGSLLAVVEVTPEMKGLHT